MMFPLDWNSFKLWPKLQFDVTFSAQFPATLLDLQLY